MQDKNIFRFKNGLKENFLSILVTYRLWVVSWCYTFPTTSANNTRKGTKKFSSWSTTHEFTFSPPWILMGMKRLRIPTVMVCLYLFTDGNSDILHPVQLTPSKKNFQRGFLGGIVYFPSEDQGTLNIFQRGSIFLGQFFSERGQRYKDTTQVLNITPRMF